MFWWLYPFEKFRKAERPEKIPACMMSANCPLK
jgi:hypothetical protein